MARKILMPPVKGINALLNDKTNKEAYDVEMQVWPEEIDIDEDPEVKNHRLKTVACALRKHNASLDYPTCRR